MARAAAEDHREPLRRAQPAGDARAAGRRPRAAVVRRPRSRSSRARWRGLKALAAPAMGALARAYVHNDIDFTGSARRALGDRRGAWSARSRTAATRSRALADLAAPAPQQPREHRLPLRRLATRSTGSGSTRSSSTRCAYFATDDTTLDDAQTAQARPHLPQAAPRAGRALSRHRLRLGRAACSTRPQQLRRRGDRHHAVEEPVRTRARPRSPRAGSRAACRSSCATISTCPRTRSTTRSRASACSSTSASRAFRKYFGKIHRDPEAGRLRAEPRHHAQPARRATASAAASAISSRNTCSPAASSRTSPR